MRRAFEAANRSDLDAVIRFFASDAVFAGRAVGGPSKGERRSAARSRTGSARTRNLEFKLEDVRDLGNGVLFAVVVQEGVPAGSAGHGHFRQREGWVVLWERGLIARLSTHEIDEARTAAERLAGERG